MELNLYGVAAMRIDKIRGFEIKKYIKILVGAYVAIVACSFLLPSRLTQVSLGSANYIERPNEEPYLRFRQIINNENKDVFQFDLVINSLTAELIHPTNMSDD